MAKGKDKKKGKGLKVHAAAAAYRRFVKAMERQGKTRNQAARLWKKAKSLKERTIRSCTLDANKKMRAELRRIGVPANVVATVGEHVKLGGAEEKAARHAHYASLFGIGKKEHEHGGFGGIARAEESEHAKWSDPSRRRRRSKKGGKRSKKRLIGYKVRGPSKWIKYSGPRMKTAMRKISEAYRTGHKGKIHVSLDPRKKRGKGKKSKVPGTTRKQYHAFVHKKVKAGHSRKAAIKMWHAHVRVLEKKHRGRRDPGRHDRDRGWFERPNWRTTKGRHPAEEHHEATEKSWSPRGSRHRLYGKTGFSKEGLAHLRAAGKKRRRGGKGRRRGR